ncbi:hypothetical protein F2Q69_00060472 [Brassica cretica]|uniref:Uncharacterized protein n=1 Tax=Brassica cretica TaxID=69181 RepID=A0A8S9RF57_BRACR|nr:hypothetical protein F2Q69_00060472 [Brassica cretica]
MSIFRQVLRQLLQHDLEHFQELLSFSIRSASVSLSRYRLPHSHLIVILHVPETLVSKATCMDIFHNNKYSLALQVYTTPAQQLDSTWSSPLTTTSASTTTSATTSLQTSYNFNLPLLALCADQAQQSPGSATTLQPRSSPGNFHTKCSFLPHEMCTTPCFSPP